MSKEDTLTSSVWTWSHAHAHTSGVYTRKKVKWNQKEGNSCRSLKKVWT